MEKQIATVCHYIYLDMMTIGSVCTEVVPLVVPSYAAEINVKTG